MAIEKVKRYWTNVEAKLNGEKITGRIVSYYQDHSRALSKGKLSKPYEFGVKLRLDKSLYNGFEGDRMWAALSVMALNIRKLLRDAERSPKLIYRFG